MTESEREKVHQLWDDLTDFPASEVDAALRHLMVQLGSWLDAQDVVWVGAARLSSGAAARRDPQSGWRGLVVRHLDTDPRVVQRAIEAARKQDSDPGLTTRALVSGVGEFRVHRLHDGFIDIGNFKRTAHYRAFYADFGIVDRLFVGAPVNSDIESFFLFDRIGQSRKFSARDAKFASYAMRGLKWFQRELLLSYGIHVARSPLSPTERRIVHLLLTDSSEEQIAAKLGQSPKTTHKYITDILRRFGVNRRTGLMALWLGRR